MPRAVLVKFDGYNVDVGYGEGVAIVPPMFGRWKYHTHFIDNEGTRRMQQVNMKRVQLPLASEPVHTVQSPSACPSTKVSCSWPVLAP